MPGARRRGPAAATASGRLFLVVGGGDAQVDWHVVRFLHGNPSYDLTYSDVFMVPSRSGISSRLDVDLTSTDGLATPTPLVAANMTAVSGRRMAETMARRGGLAIFPQDIPSDVVARSIDKVKAAHPVFDTAVTVSPTTTVGVSWKEGAATPAARLPDDWWRLFNDPELNRLVNRAFAANQDLAAAKAIWRNPDGSAITDCQGEPIHMTRSHLYQRYAPTDSRGFTHIQCPEANQVKIKLQQQG